jgi:hypothetical protein
LRISLVKTILYLGAEGKIGMGFAVEIVVVESMGGVWKQLLLNDHTILQIYTAFSYAV